ncbi:hypothetical protein PQX77_015121 [Marasmius sp. AFHP31]|nr:hypothetical protein PQX77_015121 [Marasmius sp. AFHP31]
MSHTKPFDDATYITSSQFQVCRTSFVVHQVATPASNSSALHSGVYNHQHPTVIHRQEIFSVNVYHTIALPSGSTPTSSFSPPSSPPLPEFNLTSQHVERRVVYTEDASTRLSGRIRRRCFTCGETETSAWRRSIRSPGKLVSYSGFEILRSLRQTWDHLTSPATALQQMWTSRTKKLFCIPSDNRARTTSGQAQECKLFKQGTTADVDYTACPF